MARTFVSTTRFRQAYDRLKASDRSLVDKALRHLGTYLEGGVVPIGLGLRKLASGIFEVRAGLALRIVCVEDGDRILVSLVGNHDDIRRFLRRQ